MLKYNLNYYLIIYLKTSLKVKVIAVVVIVVQNNNLKLIVVAKKLENSNPDYNFLMIKSVIDSFAQVQNFFCQVHYIFISKFHFQLKHPVVYSLLSSDLSTNY